MRPVSHLLLLKGVLGVPSLAKQTCWEVGDWLTDKDTWCWWNKELLRCRGYNSGPWVAWGLGLGRNMRLSNVVGV